MDRAIEKKRWTAGRLTVIFIACAVLGLLTYLIVSRSGTTRLKVDPTRRTVAKVKYGEFRDYFPFEGSVEPVTSVYLDIEEGGRVEEIFVEGGEALKKGDPILRFSNDDLRRRSITTENDLLQNLDRLQNTQIQLAKDKLTRKESLLNINYDILKLEKQYERYKILKKDEVATISDEEFENLEDQLKYFKDKRDLLKERIRQEDLLAEKSLEQANKSITLVKKSLDLVAKSIESLEIHAPISGHLSNLDAQIGQNIGRGQRIGQIDVLDEYKLVAGIDEYYNAKVVKGVRGKYRLEGKDYEAEVKKVYPIAGNQFYVDMAFIGEMPEDIKRGQRLTVELNFSESKESLMVKNGGFNQEGGRWVYLISEDRKTARKNPIRKGRENPGYVEIVEGLKEGDWVITSGYETFKEADILIFNEPIDLGE